ncbi:MAG: C-GCAxxG-C-C family protein [Anaerolineales bacterium]
MNNPSDRAADLFARGFNCAQAVFSAFAAQLGLDETAALRLASPFGGGMARRGEVCGAVTGALMAIGLARGASTPEGKEPTYLIGQEFMRRFEAQQGALACRALIGFDILQPEDRARARQAGVFQIICPALVRSAAEITAAMLAEENAVNKTGSAP